MFSKKTILRGLLAWTPRHRIYIACFPKSGSTYLYRLLLEITGYRKLRAVQHYAHNEQDIYEFKLRESRHHTVTQQHTKGGYYNVQIMNRWGICPVILVRNIFDIVPSFLDHLELLPAQAMGYVHPEYAEMGRDDRLAFIIRLILPWYFHFLMSWRDARKDIRTHWITYEQLFSDQLSTVRGIIEFYGMKVEDERIVREIERMGDHFTRLNVGVTGRGRQMLGSKHVEEIRELAAAWKVDCEEFRMVGL
jgi:hypothetical protein